MGMKGVKIGGEILQVQGGHIVRSTGRKDRHSKVFTAKGPRDRRVRLSAHTAIQFYDVQDRLGYDRPSKAVDWLITMAKSAIDKLSELPPRYPAAGTNTDTNGNEIDIVADDNFQLHGQLAENLIQSPLESAVDFQSYQNLGLSLQTLQDTALNLQTQNSAQNVESGLYTAGSGNSSLGFGDGYEKMVAWNNIFGLQPLPSPSSSAFPERVPLQSSLAPAPANYSWNHPTHDRSTQSSTQFISGGLPEFDIRGRFEAGDETGDVSGKSSSRCSPFSRH